MIRVALLWLVNENGELLLARRADHKKQDPGLWGPSVTGKLEAGESFEDALIRETDEELDLKAEAYEPHFLFETDFQHPDGELRHFKVYTARIPKNVIEHLGPDPDEVAEIRWQSIPQIKELLRRDSKQVVASALILWDKIFEALED